MFAFSSFRCKDRFFGNKAIIFLPISLQEFNTHSLLVVEILSMYEQITMYSTILPP